MRSQHTGLARFGEDCSPVTSLPQAPSYAPVKRRIYIWSSILAVVVAAWIGNKAWQASKNLVTLDVRDADVRDVLKKVQRQTWETIVVHKDVKGKVTLNVVKVPLEEVLGIISEQTSTRISAVYPIYSKSSSFVNLRKLARGDVYRETAGWTNFTMIGGGGGGGRGGPGGFGGRGGGGFGGFGEIVSQDTPVTLNVAAKDVGFAALALARRGNVQVVPEDGAATLVTVNLSDVPFAKAVSRVAKAADMKSDVFYSVQAMPDFFADRGERDDRDEGEGRFGGRRRGGTNDNEFGFRRGDDTNWQARAEARQDERDAQRQREMEARLATMTPEEQKKEKEDREKIEAIRNLPPEQQRQAFQEFANSRAQQFQNRMNNSFKHAKPEQRVERARRMAERKARQQSR